ncbi:MAG: hypothetical protein IT342_15645 [Candidatus Melainabacteria bacterium]|nr:hypothetical protein [Candidatus Melainabacteria bacterium]
MVKLAYAQSKRGIGKPDVDELRSALEVIQKHSGSDSRNFEIAQRLFDGVVR